ncbi:hypothetical protein [Sorangium sp. So ce233]|uniref:hypothetical protein n=1 Tax=Sorangium sp. So ce233 TaxID=3133290 RepID=UPI003F62D21D
MAIVQEQKACRAPGGQGQHLALPGVQVGDEPEEGGVLHLLHREPRKVLDPGHGMAEPRALTELVGHGLGNGDALVQRREQIDPAELVQVQVR